MQFDLKEIPFSRAGSYFVMSINKDSNQLYLRDVHGGDESPSELFKVHFLRENGDPYAEGSLEYNCTETLLTVKDSADDTKKVEFLFPSERSFHLRTSGIQVSLEAVKVRYDSLNHIGNTQYEYISYQKESKYLLDFLRGDYQVDAPWDTVGNRHVSLKCGPNSELYFVNYKVVQQPEPVQPFDEAVVKAAKEYQKWLAKMPTVTEKYQPSRQLAAYLLWTNTVRKEGLVTEDITYMSKNWMQNIWSWDNCFNAILFAEQEPELAFNQLKVFIDHQDESGAYPDFINDKYVSYSCVKPPIHAWAYRKMMQRNDLFRQKETLTLAYESFAANTHFWLEYRTDAKDGLPYYTHGNDSGWDNASIFHEGFPVTAPDLSAYLIRQMDLLADFAEQLDRKEEASQWRKQADDLFEKFLPSFFDGEQLVAYHTVTKAKIASKSSAILYLPIVLAYRFGEELTQVLVSRLLERFESPYGIATEEPSSTLYRGDGYWLGPVWAPEMYIFIDALKEAGYQEDADRLGEKFCDATLIGGMAENFDPQSGVGNDDLAFSWTSSVFLLLAGER